MTIRDFNKEYDLPMVREWWRDHGHKDAFPERLLPPVGVVVQDDDGADIAALWMYMAVEIGVCWIEYPVSAPGLNIVQTKEAFHTAIEGLTEIAKAHDYGVMIAHTIGPIARMMEAFGFRIEPAQKVTVSKALWPTA